MSDTELLEYLESLGSLEIECDMNSFYSIDGGRTFGNVSGLRSAIEKHARGAALQKSETPL